MRIVVAPDKFRGSLSAADAARAIRDGIMDVYPAAIVEIRPMADGGEGTLEAIAADTEVEIRKARVHGPLPGMETEAKWAGVPPGAFNALPSGGERALPFSRKEKVAVIEMAQASGLSLIPENKRSAMDTTTLGTGDLIAEALDAGYRQMVVGLGGSGTVDCGLGVASRLGYRFFDSEENELIPCGRSLERIARMDDSRVDPRAAESNFVVASDVDNPLIGSNGAARVYGPQKGATVREVENLDRGLKHFGEMLNTLSGKDIISIPGAGAAGGLGAGMAAFFGARIDKGAGLVASLIGLEQCIEDADLVLTGEGCFDSQSERGKVPYSVAALASKAGVPSIILAGKVLHDGLGELGDKVGVFSITPAPISEEEALTRAEELLRDGTARLMKLVKLTEGMKLKNSEEVSGG